MALLGPTRLFIFGKRCHLHGFLLIKYQKNPTYMPLLGPIRLIISEKTSYLLTLLLGLHAYSELQSSSIDFFQIVMFLQLIFFTLCLV